jgi:hypothetical protein
MRGFVPRRRSASTKRVLADAVEAASGSGASYTSKRSALVKVLFAHAKMLASERAAGLPVSVHDDLVSGLGERVAVALDRLDLDAPPAQQVAYLDGQLHHALIDACRAVDPLGRGPRTLRKAYESAWEEAAQRNGAEPDVSQRDALLDEVVQGGSPVLRAIVSYGTSAENHMTTASPSGACDASEQVIAGLMRTEVEGVISAHPDPEVKEYLIKVAAGERVRRPANFHRRLGPTLPQVLDSYLHDHPAQAISA